MGREDDIRIIAYALWVQDGNVHKSAIRHWLQAEAIWEQNRKDINASGFLNISEEIDESSVVKAE
jgi:hypothetical protein